MASDPQQLPLYAWEGKWRDWNQKTTTLKECRQYVETACAYYGVSPPKIASHGGRAYSWYLASTSVKDGKSSISFNRERGLNIPTALHEAAHAIAAALLPWEMPDHDPRFVGIYLWLLTKARIAPRVALEASLTASGIKWDRKTNPRSLIKKGP